ncbi:MAG TPA: HAMP domain-containing sensor histidine kinase, partial [Thermoanaerobaculia bacterium]|nr:HAMP domain-containing sensor histidine kinase [Thermoanaerobaculia bacterium]
MKRTVIAAVVLLAGLGGLCTAWYASSRRALAAELHEREHRAQRATEDRERAIAENLAKRLEDVRRAESQRPYFHYQNLYHDPKGISEGLSVVPSPLANGSGNPLITAHFQIESSGRVTLPTLNEELRELNAPNAAEQVVIRDSLARASTEMRTAAAPLVTVLSTDEADARIAELEKRLAASQRAAVLRARAPAAPPAKEKLAKVADVKKDAIAVNTPSQQKQIIDSAAFAQNANSNDVYRELKSRANTANTFNAYNLDQQQQQQQQRAVVTPEPQADADVTPQSPIPRAEQPSNRAIEQPPAVRPPKPVEIKTTDLQWQSIAVDGKPRLVALRGVRTPAGSLVQGVLTPLAEGMSFEGARVVRASGAPIGGTGLRLQLDPNTSLAAIRREHATEAARFQRMFAGVTMLLLLVVAGLVWMVSRAETLALEKSRFAATAAHELRTPLASLRLYSEMIADERDPARRERYAREIAGQTERLGRLVANVLEVTRIERGTFALAPREGDIGPAVEQCVEKLRPQMEAAGCPVDLRVEPNLPVVAFDADALHHIVDNLLDNAEKYSRESDERSVSVDVARETGGVAITVRDHGPGLPRDFFRDPRPFRRSASATTGGLGLGLFLVDRIVRAHGGEIRNTSAAGGGA